MAGVLGPISRAWLKFSGRCGRFVRGRVIASLLVAFLLGGHAWAQSDSDKAWYERFTDSVAKTVFFYAWPTDTYDSVEFGSVGLQKGGADVTFVIHGTSWLEGKVWTEVVLEIRNGEISNLRWGRYHALIPPGTTLTKLGQAVSSLAAEYDKQRAQTAPAPPVYTPPAVPSAPPGNPTALSAMCLENTTSDPVGYSVPSEHSDYQSLSTGQRWMFWHAGSGPFTVLFSGANGPATFFAPGQTVGAKPNSCTDAMTYDFIKSGEAIGLQPRTWIVGTAHPFMANVVRASSEGQWTCVSGYKWADADDAQNLTCLSRDTGLVGLDLRIDAGEIYPTVVSVRRNTPAAQVGIQPGSHIVQLDGVSTRGLTIDQVVARTRGAINTTLQIMLIPPAATQTEVFRLTRQ
jgi:hypothetical protein